MPDGWPCSRQACRLRLTLRLHGVVPTAEPLKVGWLVATVSVDVVAVRTYRGAAHAVLVDVLAGAASLTLGDGTTAVPVTR